jgi:hypothetical protein
MHIIIAMGEEPRNAEIPCMLFKEKQDAKDYIHRIPWLQCYCSVSNIALHLLTLSIIDWAEAFQTNGLGSSLLA